MELRNTEIGHWKNNERQSENKRKQSIYQFNDLNKLMWHKL